MECFNPRALTPIKNRELSMAQASNELKSKLIELCNLSAVQLGDKEAARYVALTIGEIFAKYGEKLSSTELLTEIISGIEFVKRSNAKVA